MAYVDPSEVVQSGGSYVDPSEVMQPTNYVDPTEVNYIDPSEVVPPSGMDVVGSPLGKPVEGTRWGAVAETGANMLGALPGMGAGALAAAGYGVMSLPNMVGLPGPMGEDIKHLPEVYKAAEEWVNNKLGGVGAQYKPGSPEGKAMVEHVAKTAEGLINNNSGTLNALGQAGVPKPALSAIEAVYKAGAETLLTIGVPELGARGIKAAVRPGEKLYLPNEKGGIVSNVQAALDKIDAEAAHKAATQGEGTIHVGSDGTATVGEMPVIKETGEQVDIARTAQQNELQRQAVEGQGQPTDLFPSEKGKAHEQKAQSLDMLADSAEKAEKPELAAAYRAQAEVERSLAKEFSDAPRQGNLDLQTVPNKVEPKETLDGNAIERPPYGEPGSLERIKFMIWETAQALAEKRAKLAALEGRDPNTINWGRDWEPDTPVRSLKDARDEIQMLEDRQASRREKLGGDAAHRELPLGYEEYVPAHDLPKFKQVVEFIKTLFSDGAKQLAAMKIERARRDRLFRDDGLGKMPETALGTTLKDGRSVIQPDGTISLPDMIQLIAENDATGKLRPELHTLLKQLTPFLYDLQLQHLGKEHVPSRYPKDGETLREDSNAVYWVAEHKLTIGNKGMNARTILHEFVHAATVRAIDRWVDTRTGQLRDPSSTPQPIQDLHELYRYVLSKTEMINLVPTLEGGFHYGFTNIKEFAAEVLTNRYLQKALADLPYEGRSKVSVLQKFIDTVKSILGIEKTTILDDLVASIEGTMDYQKANLPEITTGLKQIFRDPERIRSLIDDAGGNPMPADDFAHLRGETPETVAADKMSEVAGMHYVPEAPKITPELIEKISKEPDSTGSTVKKNITPGMLAAAHLTGSTMFKTIYQLMNAAYKKSEFLVHAHIKPVQEAFISIMRNPETASLSHSILMREMRRGTEYGAAELRAAGVPDKVINAHLQFRNMMDMALESQNAQLRAKGLPEIKAIDAYISSRWSGPWRANIRDVDGNIVFQVAEHTRKGAEQAMEYLKKKNPDLKYEDVAYRHGHEKGADIDSGYLDMLKMLDPNDPRLPALKSAYEEYLTGRTVDVSSQEKHFQAKKGVGGFAGDRPWSKTDVQDFFVQQFAYAENAFRWAEHQKAMEGVNQLLNDKSLAESQKNNIQQSREYVKSQLGFGTSKLFDALDNALAKTLGISPAALQGYMGASKTLFYLSKLGLSLPFTIIQFIQPAITTPAFHAMLDSQGFKHNPIQSTFKAITGGSQAALWHYGQFFQVPALTRLAEDMMSTLDKQAARYMESNGIIDINPMTDIKKGLRPKAVSALAMPFEFTIKHSEIIARSWAFMGFVDHLKQSGKFDLKSEKGRMELFQKAEDMTNLSMTDYRSQERAQVFEKGGLTGDAAATLHAYQLNNLMQLVSFTKQAKAGNMKPLFYMISMQALAGGLTGLWFLDDIDDMLNNLKKVLPHDQYMQVKDFSVKNFIIDNVKSAVKSGTQSFVDPNTQGKLADAVNYGVMSAATGTNIHTRTSAANQIPVFPFESQEDPLKNLAGLAPFAETSVDFATGAFDAANPNSTNKERLAGLYKAAPTVAQGPMENLPGFSKNGVSLRTKDLSQGKYRRTEAEQSLRNYGLRSTAEQEHSTKEFQLSKVERELQRRVQNESAKATDFFSEGNSKQGVEHAIKYIQLGGDPQQLISGIPKAQLALATTELERRALQAQGQSRASILKLQRYIQQVGQ